MITRQMQTERLVPPNIMDTKKGNPKIEIAFQSVFDKIFSSSLQKEQQKRSSCRSYHA